MSRSSPSSVFPVSHLHSRKLYQKLFVFDHSGINEAALREYGFKPSIWDKNGDEIEDEWENIPKESFPITVVYNFPDYGISILRLMEDSNATAAGGRTFQIQIQKKL